MTKKVDKKKKSIKKDSYLSKLLGWRDMHSYYTKRINEQTIDRIISELMHWVEEDPDALTLDQFLFAKKISWNLWDNWKKKYPQLKDAHEHVKLAFAFKREVGALKGEFNASIASLALPHYSRTWKEVIEWRESLKDKDKGTGNVTVLIDGVPTTSVVPERESHESKDETEAEKDRGALDKGI